VKIPRNLARFRGFFVLGDGAEKCMRYMVGVHSDTLYRMDTTTDDSEKCAIG
jgi:hypothetical protein